MRFNKETSSWLIVLVVLVTALITSWAMLKYKPGQDWNTAYYYPPRQVAQNLSPGIAAMQGGGLLVAGAAALPVVRAGAVAPHADRGVCTNCHTVVSSRQEPIPAIGANSTMPHEFRGVCSNCHRQRQASQSGLNPNSYRVQPAAPVAAVAQVVTPGATAPARTPTEGEWMGLEVTPITPLTARQYGIFNGTRGLVVAEAEGQAARVGIKAGDVVVSVNGTPVTSMGDFFQATRNGTLTQGVVEVVRQGQRLAIDMAPATQGNLPMAPVTAVGGGGGWGLGGAGGGNPGTCWLRQF